jgi:hypothetical protein
MIQATIFQNEISYGQCRESVCTVYLDTNHNDEPRQAARIARDPHLMRLVEDAVIHRNLRLGDIIASGLQKRIREWDSS